MPVLNGFDLYREVARHDPALAPQIIKPFKVDTIRQVVRRVLASR
jgi:hypothetical protein